MPAITITVVSLYVAQKCLDQLIKEEGYGRLKLTFFPKQRYINRLIKVIDNTITEFEKQNPYSNPDGKIAFYQSGVLFEELLKHLLFKSIDSKRYLSLLKEDERIFIPSKILLEKFLELFISKINSDAKLKKLFNEEHYQSRIFEMASAIDRIQELVVSVKEDTSLTREMVSEILIDKNKKKLTPEKLKSALEAQVNRQLKSHLNSHKYLPNTFIETGDQKEFLRFLSDSVFYSEKIFEEIEQLDFRLLNKFLLANGKPEFVLDEEVTKWNTQIMKLPDFDKRITAAINHLENQKSNIQIYTENEMSKFEYKLKNKIQELGFLASKVALINEYAGQGKTNFLCDFAENFLLKRQILTTFLTGAEIDANDIRSSILKRVFPDNDSISFSEFLEIIKCECYAQNKFFVLIIDGINENINCQVLSKNLESFIAEFLEHDFVKVIISCRTEYYEQNFSNFEKSAFAHNLKKLPALLNERTEKKLKSKLFDTYFNHFNIQYASISNQIYDQLVSNFLLLRIFCEVNSNTKLGDVKDLYKEDLFDKYYTIKCNEINSRLNNNDDFKLKSKIDIKKFIERIISFMIETNTYVNVPISKLIAEASEKEIYIRFLDENILIKRDIPADEKGVFSEEVVNFTFDEFRDFLISKYLVEIVYKQSAQQFTEFVTKQLNENSPILEGCSTFLFFIARRSKDKALIDTIASQAWYELIFDRCIFSIQDDLITDADLDTIERNFLTKKHTTILYGLIRRYNVKVYKRLNIDFLFTILRTLDSPNYDAAFTQKFGRSFSWERSINQESLVNQIEEIHVKKELTPESQLHKLFELLVYMFITKENWRVQEVYESYCYQNTDIAKRQLENALNCKNEILINEIDNFIEDYEI